MQKQLYQKLSVFLLLLWSLQMLSAQGTITGTVTNEKGDKLSGASAMIGTDMGAYSDEMGVYMVENIPAGSYELVISYIGYADQKLPVTITDGQSQTLDVVMKEDISTTNEVVVIGYGTQRKRDLTSSISKVTVVNDNVGQSFETNLQGKAAGVQVTQSSGAAGAGAVIHIRGNSSISTSGDPLYVVDGVPITQDVFLNNNRGGQNNNPLSSINPNDIESIEILKDAASAGIYGSRGANGVVLITTKRAKNKDGNPIFDFSARVGASQPTRLYQMVDSKEWLQLRQEAWNNDGKTGLADLPSGMSWEEASQNNTDWIAQTVGTGVKQDYNFGVRQAKKKLGSYIGLGYLNDESYLKGNSYERYSTRGNFDYAFSKKFSATLNTSVVQGINNRVSQAWDAGGFGAALSTLLPIYPENYAQWNAPNDLKPENHPKFRRDNRKWRTVEWRTINNIALNYKPMKGLDLRGTFNYDYMNLGDNIYENETYDQSKGIARGQLYKSITKNWVGNLTAQYTFDLGEKQYLSILGGTEAQKSTTNKTTLKLDNIDRAIFLNPNPIEGQTVDTAEYSITAPEIFTFSSYFGRVNYAFNNKYFVQGTLRSDASSRFGANYRYGFFPTVGAGWVISEEKFLKANQTLTFLKLRGSWGLIGNSNMPNYTRFGTVSNSGAPYGADSILYPVSRANPDLHWETTRTIDAGIEFGFWNDRIQLVIEGYDKHTKDLLIETTIQASSAAGSVSNGFTKYYQNIGAVQNRGIELALTGHIITKENFKWTLIVNGSRNFNKVLDIGRSSPDQISGGTNDTRIFIGQPIGVNYLVRFSHVDTETGKPVYLDKDGNETFDWNESNRVISGSVLPKFVGGVTNNFTIGNFDLSALFTFVVGGSLYDASAKRQLGVVTDWNMRKDITDRWRQPGDVAKYPRLTLDPGTYGLSSEWQYNTTQWLYDASFGRLKNISIGYNVPLDKDRKIKSLRFSLVGTNLLTFTKFPGLDPEIARDFENAQDRNMSPNITYLTAPQQKAISGGINLSF